MKHSNDRKLTPPYSELLEFLDNYARSFECVELPKRVQYGTAERKPYSKAKMSYAATTEERCPLCDSTRHQLYECEVFQRYPHETKLKTIKQEGLCMNCFVQGHVAKQCRSKPMCTKCSGPHHSFLHVERKKSSFTQSKTPAAVTARA